MVVMWWWYWMMWCCGGVMRVVVWCGVHVVVLLTLFRTRVGCWSYDYLFQIFVRCKLVRVGNVGNIMFKNLWRWNPEQI